MVQPIQYLPATAADPFANLMQGMKLGMSMEEFEQNKLLREEQAAAAQQQAALRAAQEREIQAKLDAQSRLTTASQSLIGKIRGGTATAQDFDEFRLVAPKDQSEAAMKVWEGMSKEQQQNSLTFGTQVMAALDSKNPQIGIDLLKQRAEAERRQGREDQARGYETMASLAELDPSQGVFLAGTMIGGLPGGKEAVESWTKTRDERRAALKFGPDLATAQANADKAKSDAITAGVTAEFAPRVAAAGLTKAQSDALKSASDAKFADQLNQAGLNEKNWNIRSLQNQINVNSTRLKLDADKTATDVQLTLARIGEIANSLPDQAKKDINTAAVAAGTAKQQATQFNSLADKLEKEGGGWGFVARSGEWFKNATGTQNYMSELRQEYTRLRNSAAVQSLPPGPATDKDIAMVLEGFPSSTADSNTMARFLRGMAKLQDINSATENARVDWLSNNRGSLGRATAAFPAGDFAAKPGETWVDLSNRITREISNRYATAGANAQPGAATPVGTPQGMGGAMPGVPAPNLNIRAQADAILRGGR